MLISPGEKRIEEREWQSAIKETKRKKRGNRKARNNTIIRRGKRDAKKNTIIRRSVNIDELQRKRHGGGGMTRHDCNENRESEKENGDGVARYMAP